MARQTSPPAPTQRLAGRAVRPPAIAERRNTAVQRSAVQRSGRCAVEGSQHWGRARRSSVQRARGPAPSLGGIVPVLSLSGIRVRGGLCAERADLNRQVERKQKHLLDFGHVECFEPQFGHFDLRVHRQARRESSFDEQQTQQSMRIAPRPTRHSLLPTKAAASPGRGFLSVSSGLSDGAWSEPLLHKQVAQRASSRHVACCMATCRAACCMATSRAACCMATCHAACCMATCRCTRPSPPRQARPFPARPCSRRAAYPNSAPAAHPPHTHARLAALRRCARSIRLVCRSVRRLRVCHLRHELRKDRFSLRHVQRVVAGARPACAIGQRRRCVRLSKPRWKARHSDSTHACGQAGGGLVMAFAAGAAGP